MLSLAREDLESHRRVVAVSLEKPDRLLPVDGARAEGKVEVFGPPAIVGDVDVAEPCTVCVQQGCRPDLVALAQPEVRVADVEMKPGGRDVVHLRT